MLFQKMSSKVNLLDHDTNRLGCAAVILRTKRAMCALNKESLGWLNKESVSGAHNGRASL